MPIIDHDYEPGAYGVCRRCGGDQHGPAGSTSTEEAEARPEITDTCDICREPCSGELCPECRESEIRAGRAECLQDSPSREAPTEQALDNLLWLAAVAQENAQERYTNLEAQLGTLQAENARLRTDVDYLRAAHETALQQRNALDYACPKCARCGKPAVCLGRYDNTPGWVYACDDCCGHTGSHGVCYMLDKLPDVRAGVEATQDRLQDEIERLHLSANVSRTRHATDAHDLEQLRVTVRDESARARAAEVQVNALAAALEVADWSNQRAAVQVKIEDALRLAGRLP